MSYLPSDFLFWVRLWMPVCMLSALGAEAATLIAGLGETGFRAAIAAAQEGDTVLLTNRVELQAPVRIDKRLVIRVNSSDAYRVSIFGNFQGELLRLETEGISLESLTLSGSDQTDGLYVEANVLLRDCTLADCRYPVVGDWTSELLPDLTVRLERVTVTRNRHGLEFYNLEAKDCIFSHNGSDSGAGAYYGILDGCRFEYNLGYGFLATYATVRNCVFRFNLDWGLSCDADPGMLDLSGSLFYANAGGGLLVGEQVIATIDNCTFTRHTGSPAIIVDQATEALFRHCTVADNVLVIEDPNSWPPPHSGAFVIRNTERVTLQNCLIADNPTNDSIHASGLAGPWIDGGGNVLGGSARLGALSDNGGPTLSLLPLPDSPAINAGISSDLIFDARGLARRAGASPDAGAIEFGATALVDADGDGLPDIWEVFHQLDPSNPADASSDTDGDGHDALSEFKSRTDPHDARSVLCIKGFAFGPDPFRFNRMSARFMWPRVPGVIYQVEISEDLRHWRKAQGFIYAYDNHTLQFFGPPSSSMGFYRVTPQESTF